MYITVTTTSTSLSDLIDEYDILEGRNRGETMSLLVKNGFASDNFGLSIGFDLTGITNDIRIDSVRDPNFTDSARLSAFGPLTIKKIDNFKMIADVDTLIPILII